MKAKISNFLKRKNAKRFSIFFALAFVFLIFSKLSNDYKQDIILELKIENLNEEIVIEEDSLNKLTAYVQAKGFTFVPFLFNESKEITLDAKEHLISNTNTFIFNVREQKFLIEDQLGKAYKLITLRPDTLKIKYSKLAYKIVPIKIDRDIKFRTGYDLLGELSKSVDSVKLVGASSQLDTLKFVSTEPMNLTDVQSDIEESLSINKTNLGNLQVSPNKIKVTGTVVRFTEGTLEVPIVIKNIPNDLNINYFPKTASVSFYVDLESFNTVKQSDFKVECDFNDISENQQYLTPRVAEIPEKVKRATVKQKRIDFIKL